MLRIIILFVEVVGAVHAGYARDFAKVSRQHLAVILYPLFEPWRHGR